MAKNKPNLTEIWGAGATLEMLCQITGKTAEEIADALIAANVVSTRTQVNEFSKRRGGSLMAADNLNGIYTIYMVRSPITNIPFYIGHAENYEKVCAMNSRRFTPMFGCQPAFETIDQAGTPEEAKDKVHRHIMTQECLGVPLLNAVEKTQDIE